MVDLSQLYIIVKHGYTYMQTIYTLAYNAISLYRINDYPP